MRDGEEGSYVEVEQLHSILSPEQEWDELSFHTILVASLRTVWELMPPSRAAFASGGGDSGLLHVGLSPLPLLAIVGFMIGKTLEDVLTFKRHSAVSS